MVIAGFLSFFVSTAAWQAAPEKNDFWVGKIIFLELDSGDCWGFSRVCCNVHNGVKTPVKTVKKTGCVCVYCWVIVFFSSLSF